MIYDTSYKNKLLSKYIVILNIKKRILKQKLKVRFHSQKLFYEKNKQIIFKNILQIISEKIKFFI